MLKRLKRYLKRMARKLLRRRPTIYEIYYGDEE